MITDYTTFIQYFRELAQQHTQLAGSFFVGDSWRIIAAQRSLITYPTMWLERPVKTHEMDADGDTLTASLRVGLSIVGGVATDDWDGQDARMNQCERIIGQLVARLKRDADLNLYDLTFPMPAEPLATVMADDLYGWRIEFDMTVRTWTDCYHADDWTGIPADGPTLPGGYDEVQPGGTFTIPQGHLLDKLIIHSATLQAVSVGTTLGGAQIIDAGNVFANSYIIHTEDIYAPNAPKTLYFSSDDPITIRYRLTNFFPT
jgi:hypothetical protein